MRAISTVLDVGVFLVLVSAAIGTVVYAPTPVQSAEAPDETAAVLATTTASVEYDIRQGHRESHGTLATLLGRAAIANTTLRDAELTPYTGEFQTAVREQTLSVLSAPNQRHVTAHWEPYRNAPVGGQVSVGARPPDGVDVTLSTLTVPSSLVTVDTRTVDRVTYDAVGAAVASAVTETLLPETSLDGSFGQESPTATVSASRYQTVASALGVSVQPALAAGNVDTAHDTVTDALARILADDMSSRFESPSAALDAVQTGTVQITVRRWEP